MTISDFAIKQPIITVVTMLILVVGIVYYLVAARGREDRGEVDRATGEAVIG